MYIIRNCQSLKPLKLVTKNNGLYELKDQISINQNTGTVFICGSKNIASEILNGYGIGSSVLPLFQKYVQLGDSWCSYEVIELKI